MYDLVTKHLYPDDLPKIPSHTYLKKGWISMSDWLGKDK